jgi:hypothetical protein
MGIKREYHLNQVPFQTSKKGLKQISDSGVGVEVVKQEPLKLGVPPEAQVN